MEARPPVRLKPDTSAGFRPPYRVHPEHIRQSLQVARSDGALGRFDLHPQWATHLREQAYLLNTHASTSLEGNPLDLEEARRAIEKAGTTGRLPRKTAEREVVQHYRWFHHLGRRRPEDHPPLTIDEILQTHTYLLKGVVPAPQLGTHRGPGLNKEVYFGGNTGTPPERVREELESLLRWYDQEGGIHPIPIRVAIWLHEFLSIHPFTDGNGRVARALTHRLLYTHGLPCSLMIPLDRPFNEDRQSYYDGFDATRIKRDLSPWTGYFLECLASSYRTTDSSFIRLQDLKRGLTGAEKSIIDHVLRTGDDELIVSHLAPATGYRPVTISLALRRLAESHGLVTHNGKRGKASAYHPTPRFKQALLEDTPGA